MNEFKLNRSSRKTNGIEQMIAIRNVEADLFAILLKDEFTEGKELIVKSASIIQEYINLLKEEANDNLVYRSPSGRKMVLAIAPFPYGTGEEEMRVELERQRLTKGFYQLGHEVR